MIDRRLLTGIGVAALLVTGLAGCSSPTSVSTSDAASSAPSDAPGGGAMPSGAAAGGGTGKTMTGASTAKLTAAIAEARSNGAGVNLGKTLSSELDVSETKVAAGLKAMGADGP